MARHFTRRRPVLSLERLEIRDAPAALVGNNKVTYQDLDGDNVTVTLSKPLLDSGNAKTIFTFDTAFDTAGQQQLKSIDLTSFAVSGKASGVTITTSAVRNAVTKLGDGFAAVGQINADGIDLGAVTIDGDLGKIVAGDANLTNSGLKGLTAQSMGRFGTSTGAGADLNSVIQGKLDFVTIRADVKEAFINVQGSIGPINIGGSLLGGATALTGRINSTGNIGAVTIKGNLTGGGGDDSGALSATEKIASLTIGGSVLGGGGLRSGHVLAGSLGAVLVRGSVVGGIGEASAGIASQNKGAFASVTINGSVKGGDGFTSGVINSDGTLGPVKIVGDLAGGSGPLSGFTGRIQSVGTLASVTIGGSLRGGSLDNSGRIYSNGAIGPVKITGDVIGGGNTDSGAIIAFGNLTSVTIGGSMRGSIGERSASIQSAGALGAVKITGDIVGGSGKNSGSINASTTLASVTIGGSLIGGINDRSGSIVVDEAIGTLKITGDIVGGSGEESGAIDSGGLTSATVGGSIIGGAGEFSGFIGSGNLTTLSITGDIIGGNGLDASGAIDGVHIGSVTLGGSLIAGPNARGGSIGVQDDIGKVTVGGSLIGTSANPAIISAGGETHDLALGSVKIAGRVEYGLIWAGVASGSVPGGSVFTVSADAQIGPVTVGGDWIASSIAAGVVPTDAFFGNPDDARIVGPKDNGTISSKITSLTIGGQALGTIAAVSAADQFGIEAENVGAVKIGGTPLDLHAGNGNDDFSIGITGDFRVHEI